MSLPASLLMKNPAVVFWRVLILAFPLLLGACASDQNREGSGIIKLRFSTVGVPRDAHTLCLYTFKEELERSTAGRIKVEIFHSGQLFTQESEQLAVRRGTVAMVYTGAHWLAEHVPYFSMFTMGYLFKDYSHMARVFNGSLGERLFEDVARKIGVRPLGAFYLGTRQLNLRDTGHAVRRPEDLKGVKLRMPNSPSWLFLGQALGANPTTISFSELYMALKTGTVDGQDNPLPTTYNAKFYEVAKYIVLTGHLVHAVFPCINEGVWRKLDPELQGQVRLAIEQSRQVCDSLNLKAETELIDYFKSRGVIVSEPDREAFKQHVRKQYLENEKLVGDWDQALFREVEALAE